MQVAHGHALDGAARTGSDYRGWIGWGLLIAAGHRRRRAGLFGSPFLTSTYDYPWLPGVGGVPLASAAAFDLGVYLVVVGGTMVMLLSIARLSPATGAALMLLLLTLAIGMLTACGVWLLLRARSFDAMLGLTLLSYAVNLFIFAAGPATRRRRAHPRARRRRHAGHASPTRCRRRWC